ncbi:MAG: topoisomerase DNA-binding C4 zinc finger domain-containing protein [Rhodanobacteraceae bacterium]
MYGLLNHHAADAVKIVSVGEYTDDARRFAQAKPIELVGSKALLALVRNVQTAQTPYAVEAPQPSPTSASTPGCPKCGAGMLKRENRSTKQAFWGCTNYPKCRGTRPA